MTDSERRLRGRVVATRLRMEAAREAFEDAVRAAHHGGVSLRSLEVEAGLKKSRIAEIVRNGGGETDGEA